MMMFFVLIGLCIGIMIGLCVFDESLWINGIKQNVLFFVKLLMVLLYGYCVMLVNMIDVLFIDVLLWDCSVYDMCVFVDMKDVFDVVIELGGQIDGEQMVYLKVCGVKLVSYCCGVEYINVMELMLFGCWLWDLLFINCGYDEVWVILQIVLLLLLFLQLL